MYQTPTPSLIKRTYLIYALHIFSAINGLLTPAFIVTAFLSGWPSIIALILSYVWKGEAAGTWLSTHFDWLIKTFWYALIGLAICWALIITIVGALIGGPGMIFVGLWVLYRLARGLLTLNDRKLVD